MKLFLRRAALLVIVSVISIFQSENLEASFVDPRLDAWLSVSDSQNALTNPKQKVIVFLKAPTYHDHSGLDIAQAIVEEKTFVRSYLREESKEIITLLPLQSAAADYLWSSNGMIVEVDRAALQRLRAHSAVEAIVYNQIISLDDPLELRGEKAKTDESSLTYGLQLIGADAAWKQGITGEGVTIGIIDSGCDDSHPDLKGKIIRKKDFTEEANDIDGAGHGTHVAGTIVGGNASGVSIGVAPGARLVIAKALDAKGSGSLANLLKAMEWMLDPDGDPSTNDAPRLVSNSWGASTQFVYGFRNAVRSWRRFGIFPNFAAGNSGPFYFTANSPGSYPFSYAVGAVDENADVTSFSSRGPTIWWKGWLPTFIRKPDISAPGLYVTSSLPDGKYETMSGTSMATPHIAGVAALAFQANPLLTVEDVMEILNTSHLDRGNKGGDNRYGHGIVQVDQVIAKAKSWKVNGALSFQDKDPSSWEWDTP